MKTTKVNEVKRMEFKCEGCKFFIRKWYEIGAYRQHGRSGIDCEKFGRLAKMIGGERTSDYLCGFNEERNETIKKA